MRDENGEDKMDLNEEDFGFAKNNTSIDAFWNEFVKASGLDEDALYAGDLTFDGKGNTKAALLELLLSGKKTVMFNAFEAYTIDREPLPVSGEYSVVLDFNGEPSCIIRTENVSVVPFGDISWELASREGEDENLEEWRERKKQFFEEEGDVMGYEFSNDMRVVAEIFSVVYRRQ